MIPAAAAPPERAWWLARLHPATRLGALPLSLVTCVAAPAWLLPPLLALVGGGLRRGGLSWRAQGRALLPWWPAAVLVVAIHTFTTVSAAPLGHPSAAGAARGVTAVARVVASLLCLRLFARLLALGDLVAALAWWGVGRFGGAAAVTRLGVALSVAAGTAPAVVAEGRRITAALRLRRGRTEAAGPARRWWRRAVESTCLPLPLLEGLFRRAEALTLSLRGRLPHPTQLGPPPRRQLAALAAWLVALVALAVWRGRLP